MNEKHFKFRTISKEANPEDLYSEEYWSSMIIGDSSYWAEQTGFTLQAEDKEFLYTLTVSRAGSPPEFSLGYDKNFHSSFKGGIGLVTTNNTGDMNEFLVLPNLIAIPKRSLIESQMALHCVMEFINDPQSVPKSASWFESNELDWPEDL